MQTNLGRATGMLLVLMGAASTLAALGGMDSAGIHSWPGQWLVGAAGLICGRLLLLAAFDLDGAGSKAVVAIQTDPDDAGHRFGAPGERSQEQSETEWFSAATKL